MLQLDDTWIDDTWSDDTCVARLKTSYWSDYRGIHEKKSLLFMRRKSHGYNILMEDSENVGAEEVISRIENLHSYVDGIYHVIICDKQRGWEIGPVDDYSYRLVRYYE